MSETTKKTSHSEEPPSPSEDDKKAKPIVIFFVCLGLSMPQVRIDKLTQRAKKFGATVIPGFQSPRPKKKRRKIWGPSQPDDNKLVLPTHLVLDKDCRPASVSRHLQFQDTNHLEQYLNDHNIQCAIPEWITRATGPLSAKLREHQRWWKSSFSNTATGSPKRSKRGFVSDDDDDHNEEDHAIAHTGAYPNNTKIADALQTLAKLHQECPLAGDDMWKSYTLDKAAGRIRSLPFEITLSKESQAKLAQVWGVGKSTTKKINDVLTKGTIPRIAEFQKDPQRLAMKRLMDIWGIGRPTAITMMRNGFRDIRDVRKRMDELVLSRNQKIGIECYEDFLERMSRQEVETIGKIIEEAIRKRFPLPNDQKKLDITVMGSYRRGKESCGDVDMLITHEDYIEMVPPHALGEIVEDLLESGQMAYHLTFIAGMKIRSKEEYHAGGYNVGDGVKDRSDGEAGSFYMGVFQSPCVPGRRRRVDIKFYPHRERAFATLYFTGNGYFNRSMRLYATRMRGNLQLSDKGLFTRDERKQRVMEASTEREVFDYLGLEYKEPHERLSFDAVVTDKDKEEKLREWHLYDKKVEEKELRKEQYLKWVE